MANCGDELTKIASMYDRQLIEMGQLRNKIGELEITCEVRRAVIYYLLDRLSMTYDDIPWKEIQSRLQ